MKSKKMGLVVMGFAVLFFLILLNVAQDSKNEATESDCYQQQECASAATTLTATNIGIGIIFALFSFGLYTLLFSKEESALLQAIEKQKDSLLHGEKMRIITMLLSQDEQRVLQAIREQEGITQSTLRIRAQVPKATLSQILKFFEDKNLITREPQGKTYAVYLNKAI